MIGIILASLKPELDESKLVKKVVYNWVSIIIVNIIMMIGITVAVDRGFAVNNYMMYSFICLPCFMFTILGLSGVKVGFLEKSKVLSYCSNTAYVFFLAQLFSNRICKLIIAKYPITNNLLITALGWVVCIIIAIVFHEALEKPITKILKKRFLA